MTNSKTFSVVTLVICLLALTIIVVARPANGQVLHVPSDFSTIQAAVDAAAEGDTVR